MVAEGDDEEDTRTDEVQVNLPNVFTESQMMTIQFMLDEAVRLAISRTLPTTSVESMSGETTTVPSAPVNVNPLPVEIPKPRQVSRSQYIATPSHILHEIKSFKIMPNTPDKRNLIRSILRCFDSIGLSSLLLGYRKEPIRTVDNPYGYTEASFVVVKGLEVEDDVSILSGASNSTIHPTTIYIDEDDYGLFMHDRSRLMVLVIHIFDEKSYHYIGEEGLKKSDPALFYSLISGQIFGSKSRDIVKARDDINSFKLNVSVPIQKEHVRWEKLFLNLSHAQQSEFSEGEKMNFLISHLFSDTRPGINALLTNCMSNGSSYAETMRVILLVTSQVSDNMQVHTMAKVSGSISSKSIVSKSLSNVPPKNVKYCFEFLNKGKCLKKGCLYIHENKPEKNAFKQPASKYTDKEVHLLSRDYRDIPLIGKGIDKLKNDKNIHGYSKAQVVKIKMLDSMNQPSTTSSVITNQPMQDFSSWRNESLAGFSAKLGSVRVLKRKIEESECKSDDDQENESQESESHKEEAKDINNTDDDKSDCSSLESIPRVLRIPVQSRSQAHDDYMNHPQQDEGSTVFQPVFSEDIDGSFRTFNMSEISWQLTTQKYALQNYPFNRYLSSAIHIIDEYYSDTNYIKNYDRSIPTCNIHPSNFMYSVIDEEDLRKLPDWKIRLFGMNHKEKFFKNHIRKDITEFSCNWQNLMLHCARSAFGTIVDTNRQNPCTKDNQGTCFSIESRYFRYINSFTFGHIWSQMTCVEDYVIMVEAIIQLEYSSGDRTNILMIDTLLHALVYDFMAFVAQHLGMNSKEINVEKVSFIRSLIYDDVNRINNRAFHKARLLEVFQSIVLYTRPIKDTNKSQIQVPRYSALVNHHLTQRNTGAAEITQDNLMKTCNIKKFFNYTLTSHSISNVSHQKHRIIIDTGASVCATSNKSLLKNIRSCNDMIAYPAFGPEIIPESRGDLGILNLDTLLIPNMPDTLISVSKLCYGGSSGLQNVAIFTTEGVRVFRFDSIRAALKLIDEKGTEILRGYISDGIYIIDREQNAKKIQDDQYMFLARFKPQSLYDHVHMVTGHPGQHGMKWHKQNSVNSQYTIEDENRHRGICQGCVYGSLSQTGTDHFRDHRPNPHLTGQCFALDAYTHGTPSSRNNKYCDILTDLASRKHYPILTKNRSAQELVEKCRILFLSHPEWQSNADFKQRRFIRLDAESNYRSIEFLTFVSSIGYVLEHTPVRDKHAGGIAERAVGIISAKTNVAMMAPTPRVPQPYWDYAMVYACETHSFNYSSVLGTSPYIKINGVPINLKYCHAFWECCYVQIPLVERKQKIGAPRAYKAHFVGYANTTLLFPNYIVIPVNETGHYMNHRESKNVIFDPTINFTVYTQDEEPYDSEFVDTDHYVPFLQRDKVQICSKGNQEISPERTPISLQPDRPETPNIPIDDSDDIDKINYVNEPYEDEHGSPIYWYNFTVRSHEYPLIMCETQHFSKMQVIRDPRVPSCYRKAVLIPAWVAAINTELDKFEKNKCFELVPYTTQHLVPMMWTFTIKTDGTLKARLVGRGDLMKPYIDFDPNAVYCGNVSACSIKICITIAAKYKLTMRGGDLEGAYLVTRASTEYPIHIKTPPGYKVPEGMCMSAKGNIYGTPPAGQNFSKEFDKCVFECGYKNTPWDLKFFYKWVNDKPILLIAHSDDFRWFGHESDLDEWHKLINTFENDKHKYKVNDVTDKEFVGIKITKDKEFNYYLDQTRMINEIIEGAQMKNARDEKLPYPMTGDSLSKQDNATPDQVKECTKYPYRRYIGQLMYIMVHTSVTIMYALNVLSRYCNNPGPRHIEFAKHLLRYVRTSKTDRLKFNTHDGPIDIDTMTSALQLKYQCDADLAGNLDTRHSQTSYIGYLGDQVISWCSTDQGSIATSTAESEIKAVNHTLKSDVISSRGIMNNMGWKQSPTVIEEDNKACVDASIVSHMTRGLRHLEITENFLKEKYQDGTCIITKIDSKNNNADIGTKRVPLAIFEYLTYPIIDKSLRTVKR